ncbi:MAG: hypothetical protein WKF84_00215 [Pyrinomonadaceae bacterium]
MSAKTDAPDSQVKITSGGSSSSIRELRAVVAEYLGMVLVLVGLVAFFSLSTTHFFSVTTFRTTSPIKSLTR